MRMPSLTWTQIGTGIGGLAVAGWIASGMLSRGTDDSTRPPQTQLAAPAGAGTGRPAVPDVGTSAPSTEAVGATIDPAATKSGDVVFTLTMSDVRHMYDAAEFTAAAAGSNNQGGGNAAKPPAGSAVLNGIRKVTNNIDQSQKPPADAKAQGDMVRHFVLNIQRGATGETVPYLEVTMDMLRNGRPVKYDQALLPMVAAGDDATKVYYGNNIAFPGKGVYQVFVRLSPNPFLGTEAPPAAQFNITFK